MNNQKKVFIIAEAGDNHNGNYDTALKLVDKAVEAGADCVKFQTFVTERVILNWQIYCNYGASMAILPRRGVDF